MVALPRPIVLIYVKLLSVGSAVNSILFYGSMLIFASCVIHRRLVFCVFCFGVVVEVGVSDERGPVGSDADVTPAGGVWGSDRAPACGVSELLVVIYAGRGEAT